MDTKKDKTRYGTGRYVSCKVNNCYPHPPLWLTGHPSLHETEEEREQSQSH